jgi:hypothetical protein
MLNGDDRLISEDLQQLDLLVGERTPLVAEDGQGGDAVAPR